MMETTNSTGGLTTTKGKALMPESLEGSIKNQQAIKSKKSKKNPFDLKFE